MVNDPLAQFGRPYGKDRPIDQTNLPPILGQQPVFDPKTDPRTPLILKCPNGCKDGTTLQVWDLAPHGYPLTAKARCVGCLTYWEVTPDARIGKVATFEMQVRDAIMKINDEIAKTRKEKQ